MKKVLVLLHLLYSSFLLAGTITCSTSTFPTFGNVYPSHSSTSLRYTVSGAALTSPLIITAPNGFEVSLTYGFGYSKSLTIIPISGNITTTNVFVRFSPSSTGAASGSLINSSVGSTSVNIAVSGNCIAWAIPANYYSTVNTQRNAALKTVLYNRISTGTTSLSYTPGVWNAFATTDVQPNGKVWDPYSTRFEMASPYEFTLGTDQDAGSGGSSEGDKYNREHSFPQSWFATASPMVSDVHHVFATDKFVNAQRGDLPYGTVSVPNWTSLLGGKRGPSSASGYTGTVFEPVDEYKGDIARAQLYMATRYENLVAGWQNNATANNVLAGNIFPAYDAWYVNLLLSWHNLDPVSDKEIKRNNAIYALQNNRNPFVDSPQFVQRIWGGSLPTEPTLNASNLLVTQNGNTGLTLNWKSGNGQRRLVLMRAVSPVNALPQDTFHYIANANLLSAPQIGNGNYIVYNGTGSSVSITNLNQGTTYHFAIIEYNGWYTSTNYFTSSYFTSNANTLPVEWISFHASLKENQEVLLTWSTASEFNNEKFEVEYSADGLAFVKIGEVPGKRNSHQLNHYRFTSPTNHISGDAFFRLKQVDVDGTFDYSEIRMIAMPLSIKQSAIAIHPNPFTGQITLAINNLKGAFVFIQLQNLNGQTIVYDKEYLSDAQTVLHFDWNNLNNGVYFLTIRQEDSGECIHHKLVKY
jgi:endonuclease I